MIFLQNLGYGKMLVKQLFFIKIKIMEKVSCYGLLPI